MSLKDDKIPPSRAYRSHGAGGSAMLGKRGAPCSDLIVDKQVASGGGKLFDHGREIVDVDVTIADKEDALGFGLRMSRGNKRQKYKNG